MNPFAFEARCLLRSRGAWVALVLALAPAIFTVLATAAIRNVTNQPEMIFRIWLPTVFVVASMSQTGLFPFVLTYLLGDSLAGQAEDGRLKSLLLSPASVTSIYLGKLGSVAAAGLAVLLLSMLCYSAAAGLALSVAGDLPDPSERNFVTAVSYFAGLQVLALLALAAFLAFVFSYVRSFKAGLLGAAAVAATMLALQFIAPRINDSFDWLPAWMFTGHYWQACSPTLLIKIATGSVTLSREAGNSLLWLAADVVVFGALGALAFRRREV